ncbi:DUF4190 domain-containing protein [Streptomyces sp. NPDC004111]|uniref:DUF4190 domain-containing protein n=1 Tax=Streptomyces sp. NPDC004111 TaxID=3364690 RepID=UPI0036C2069F
MTTPLPPSGSDPWAAPDADTPEAPPTGPDPHGTGPRADPYAHPAVPPPPTHPGPYTYPGGYGMPFAPPPPPRNGMGVTALVLGLVSTLLGLLVVLFWATWLPGLLALVFGLVALGQVRRGTATNKGAAVAGAVLGAVGLLFSGGGGYLAVTGYRAAEARVAEHRTVDGEEYGDPSADDGADADTSPADRTPEPEPEPEILPFGKSFTYEDGVKVTVSAPKSFTPDRYTAHLLKPGNRAYFVRITIDNGSTKRLSPLSYPQVTDQRGADVDVMVDSAHVSYFARTILPGNRSSAMHAFQVPKDAATRLQLEYAPDYEGHDFQMWTGPAE